LSNLEIDLQNGTRGPACAGHGSSQIHAMTNRNTAPDWLKAVGIALGYAVAVAAVMALTLWASGNFPE
jgi:hypothetical protein